MFRRAVITDEISQDLDRALVIAKRYGLEGAELRTVWDKQLYELADDQLDQVEALLSKHGMMMPCVAAPVFKCDLGSESDYAAHLKILERCAELGRRFGTQLVRGFTFWARGDFQADLPLIVERLRGAEDVLRKTGAVLVLEYDPATSAGTSQKLEQVLAQVASEHIQALFDPGNNLYDREGESPFPDGYNRLKPWINHVHVKDVVRVGPSGKPESVVIGQGEVGFPALFAQLVADAYDGWASLETHYRKAAAIPEELLHRPYGSAFSEGGEEASIECMEAWNGIMQAQGLLP